MEQTRKGIRKVRGLGVRFPVINMADAMAKLVYESPMIGLALAKSAMRRLAAFEQEGHAPGKQMLVLGFGEIGERAAKALRAQGHEVSIYDIDEAARARAVALGFAVHDAQAPHGSDGITALQSALSKSKVVLSTTGTIAIKPADMDHAHEGAIFLNGASSATEFASFAEDQRDPQLPYMRQNTGGWGALVKQRDVTVTTRSGKMLTLASLGQVINFDNGPGVLPPRYAQLIVGLLYSSSLQAARTTAAGIHDLELQSQHELLDDVHADLAETDESLLDPKF